METLKCDILVVGAGPAGSSAARAAAKRGLKVLVAERRNTVGSPVRCAEFIPAPLLGEVDGGGDFVVQFVRGMRTILPDGEVTVTRAPGFMIRRDLLDQSLARAAEEQGARLMGSTRVLRMEQGAVVARKRGDTQEARILARVIIGADGPRSTVGRWIGSENGNLIPAVQWRVPLVNPMDHTEVYFDKDFYGGYGWLFPVGGEANVGVGRKGRDSRDEPVGLVLKRFVLRLAEEGKVKGERARTTAGWIPAEPVRSVIKGNVLLVGDAAGHTHPMTGAGVSQAVIGGEMAGKWAAHAAGTGDLGLLHEYEKEWRELFADVQERAHERRKSLEENWDRLDRALKTSWIAFKEYYD